MSPRRVLPAVLATLLLASACTSAATTEGSGSQRAGAAPDIAAVDTLSDPRDWEGPTTAAIQDPGVRPVDRDPDPRLPVTVTDAQGTRVTVTDTSRVLALDIHGTLSRTVFELGLGDRVVGRDISTDFEAAAELPLVTQGGHDLNAEAILALDPTVILTDTSLGPWDVLLQMRDAGIPVVVLDPHRGLDNVGSLTRAVADALGVPEAGADLARRTEREISRVRSAVDGAVPEDELDRLRTVFLYVRGGAGVYSLFGEGTGADALIEAIGGYDVAAEIGWSGMKPVTSEGIIAAQPEVVLVMSGGLESVGGVDGLLEKIPALEQTPAGENHRVVDMADSQILGFGPLTGRVLNALTVALYAPAAIP